MNSAIFLAIASPCPPFLGFYAAERTGGVNQANDRAVEFLRLMCQTQSLAVALRMRHGEIRCLVFPQVSALDLCQNRHRQAVQSADAADNGTIVPEIPVAVHFIEICKDPRDIIPNGGTVFVPYQKLAFPRRPVLLLLFHCQAPPASCSRS